MLSQVLRDPGLVQDPGSVHWYVACPLSYRQIEETMQERGAEADHSTLRRWVVKSVPLLEGAVLARKGPAGGSWIRPAC